MMNIMFANNNLVGTPERRSQIHQQSPKQLRKQKSIVMASVHSSEERRNELALIENLNNFDAQLDRQMNKTKGDKEHINKRNNQMHSSLNLTQFKSTLGPGKHGQNTSLFSPGRKLQAQQSGLQPSFIKKETKMENFPCNFDGINSLSSQLFSSDLATGKMKINTARNKKIVNK